MDLATPDGRLLAAARDALRQKGLLYRDVAERLHVSEGTVKRYFAGKGVTLAVLCKLADLADTDVATLAARADQQLARKFTKAQQQALGKNRLASGIYFLLWHGWTVAQIKQEFELDAAVDDALADLEFSGLIKRQAHGIRIVATPDLRDRGGGPLEELTRELASRFLTEINLLDGRCEWSFFVARLSPASVQKLRETIDAFFEQMRAMTIDDAAIPPDRANWYRIFIGAQPVSRKWVMPRRKGS